MREDKMKMRKKRKIKQHTPMPMLLVKPLIRHQNPQVINKQEAQ